MIPINVKFQAYIIAGTDIYNLLSIEKTAIFET
jgi:hypothetical protein